MSRLKCLLVAAAAFAATPFIYAADAATNPAAVDVAHIEVALPAPTLTLQTLVAANVAVDEVIEVTDGVAIGAGAFEVVLARIDTDGKVVMSCVDSEKAAQAFLQAPIEKIATKKAKDQ